ncbi:MAG: HAD-IA family hydrolase [Lachnospiraceae bacterium]|nr:HAD-IA family hydrolase [Lachnospiraceae bacterium]
MKHILDKKDIIGKIRKYDIVSFDVFDTLIKRKCINPNNVFSLSAKAIKEKYNIPFSIEEITSARIIAESEARDRSEKKEITIDDVYSSFSLEKFEYIKELKEEEINIEYSMCVANSKLKDVYDWCVANNKQIIIISDMYLSKDNIKNILEINGYNHNSDIFVSSEYGMTKKNGSLYKKVVEKYQGKSIVHIGDALKSDYIQARLHGFGAYHVNRKKTDSTYDALNDFPVASNCSIVHKHKDSCNYEAKENSDYYSFASEVFGPSVIGFCKWLFNEIEKTNVDIIFFQARDGYLIKRVFNLLYPEYAGKTDYLYVSRKAIRLSSLYNKKNLDSLVALFPQHTLLSLKDLCCKLGANKDLYQKAISNYNLDEDSTFFPGEILTNKNLNSFCNCLLSLLQPECKRENILFNRYIKSKKKCGNVAVVDIGWAGTIQNMLTEITGLKIIGYYFGTDTHASSIIKKSFVDPSIGIQEFAAALIEYPFLAPEGSVEKYIETERGTVEPVLSEFEYGESEKKIIIDMQNGVLDFAAKHSAQSNDSITSEVSLARLIRVCRNPSSYELNLLGDLTYYESGNYYLAKPQKLKTYILKPKKLKKDLSSAGWKIGFLRRLFKVNIDYYRILKFIKGK